MAHNLNTELQYVKGVGSRRGAVLAKMGIGNIRDLLYFVPKGRSKYQFYKGFQNIADCQDGDEVVVKGFITSIDERMTRNRRKMFEVSLSDDTGTLVGVWFNPRSFIIDAFEEGQEMIFRGKVSLHNKLQITHPRYEKVKEEEVEEIEANIVQGTIIPVYPETADFHEHIGQAVYRKIVKQAWEDVKDQLVDPIPDHVIQDRGLCSIVEMFRCLHFPESKVDIDTGIERYKFQELFSMSLGIAVHAHQLRAVTGKEPIEITAHIDRRIRKRFPFTFTKAQEKAVADISRDLQSTVPMNRLIQGDVGSGKTAVAVYSILAMIANQRQVAFMAPTSILAEQHFKTFDALLKDSKVRYALLVGGMKASQRTELLEKLKAGEIDVIIGTHALIQKDIEFNKLGLVIVDEQHKFGVLQRKELSDKGLNPDILLMTATPIPRTLSMTAYGEYDISIIDELPPGRSPVKTYWFGEKSRDKGYDIIRDRVRKGEQVYVVCPLVDESADLDLKSAVMMHVQLGTMVFPGVNVGLLHGRMKDDEKEEIMNRFRSGEIQILVSTVVIEVGVDVPNATMMIIEHAERFGLAQLHQLRGRIGRGELQSICVMFAAGHTEQQRERVGIMTETNDGFKIAEKDFEMRGPGEYFGTRQSGIPDFYLADLRFDRVILYGARESAFQIVGLDPEFKKDEYKYLPDLMKRKFKYGVDLLGVT